MLLAATDVIGAYRTRPVCALPFGDKLAFEIACQQARLFACDARERGQSTRNGSTRKTISSAHSSRTAKIKRNTAAIRRGADTIDASYEHLRDEALGLLDEIRRKLD